jgi:hypothetical protein
VRKVRIWILLALLVFTGQALATESSVHVTLVKAAHLLDPRSGNVLSPAAVLIEGNKIKEVGAPAKVQVQRCTWI